MYLNMMVKNGLIENFDEHALDEHLTDSFHQSLIDLITTAYEKSSSNEKLLVVSADDELLNDTSASEQMD